MTRLQQAARCLTPGHLPGHSVSNLRIPNRIACPIIFGDKCHKVRNGSCMWKGGCVHRSTGTSALPKQGVWENLAWLCCHQFSSCPTWEFTFGRVACSCAALRRQKPIGSSHDHTDGHLREQDACKQTGAALERRRHALAVRAEGNPGSSFPSLLPSSSLAGVVWLSCGLPKDTPEVAALKNAILQRHLQKHQKEQMTFQIACGIYFKADKRPVNTEPGELISEKLHYAKVFRIKPLASCKCYSREINTELCK